MFWHGGKEDVGDLGKDVGSCLGYFWTSRETVSGIHTLILFFRFSGTQTRFAFLVRRAEEAPVHRTLSNLSTQGLETCLWTRQKSRDLLHPLEHWLSSGFPVVLGPALTETTHLCHMTLTTDFRKGRTWQTHPKITSSLFIIGIDVYSTYGPQSRLDTVSL